MTPKNAMNGNANGKHAMNGKANGNFIINGNANGKHEMNGKANGNFIINGNDNGKHEVNGKANGKHEMNGNANGKHLMNGKANGKHEMNGKTNGFRPKPVAQPVAKPFGYNILQIMSNLLAAIWSIITFGRRKFTINWGIMGVERKNNTWIKNEGTGLPRGYEILKELKDNGICTMGDIPGLVRRKYGKAILTGTRRLIRRDKVEEGGKIMEKLHLGDYNWKNCEEIEHEVLQVATSFNKMGLKKGDKIGILAETREDWFVCAMGAETNGLAIVTMYTNLNDAGITHCINETEISTIVTSCELLPRLVGILGVCPTIKTIIVIEDQLEGIGKTNKIPESIKVVPFSDMKGEIDINEDNKPVQDDLAIIMYTSGSTGTPKGVEITHKNMFYSMFSYVLQANVRIGDRYMAFLPLAHIMELTSEIAQMTLGANVAYGSPFTLTNNSPKIAKGTIGDAVMARPTTFTAVALILDRIVKGISQKVSKAGILQRKLFEKALHEKITDEHSVMSKIFDAVVFKKVRAELGGRVRMMVVGGAPLSGETHDKIRAMFGCSFQCGYGCTETAASACSMQDFDTRTGHVGPPNNLAFIKLENWEEGGYLTTDKPYPRGEIIIGGGCVAKGYFKQEEETKKCFYNAEGTRWFRTGDIGEIDESGVVKIIDRMKDLVKLTNGEYVSLGGVETCTKTNCLVENICVFANSLQDYTVCVAVPNAEPFLKRCRKEFNIKELTIEEACSNPKMCQMLLMELQDHCKKHGLNRWDIPQEIHLTPNPWTPECGLVTAAFKLRRRNLQAEYSSQVQAMYRKRK